MSETNDAHYQGGCACGAVRYTMKARPMFINACHCTDCQRQTGGPFAINGIIEASEVTFDKGQIVTRPQPSPSGRGHDIMACADCGTALWSDYGKRPYLMFLRMTTLDEPQTFKPDAHIFTKSKLPWLELADGVPAFDVFYDMKTVWSAEGLERRKRASEGAKA